MNIPEQFYEPEVRDGFYVPSEMKRYWAAMLEVLGEVDRICRKYGLKYYADYGTLIGAIRHGGFIPWDDDLDISMLREDYMVFLKVAEKELPSNYKVLSIYNNPEVILFLGRVVNNGFISTEADFLAANHNCPYTAGIDIFPIDHFDYDETFNDLQKMLINAVDGMTVTLDENETDVNKLPDDIRERVLYYCDVTKTSLEEGRPIRQQMMILSDRIGAVFDKESPYVAHMYFWETNGNQVYPKEYYENVIRVPFECTYISVPIAYDKILSTCYGPEYITPVRSGGIHDYPLYSAQKDYMREAVNRVYYDEYSFNNTDLTRPQVIPPKRDKKEMVFLPFSPRYWKYMEKEWAKYVDSDEWDVYVVPIPYYRKAEYGQNKDLVYEAGGYPDYVAVTGFDKYDFDRRLPDRIVIQNPYDEFDNAISVHPRFYSNLLREVTSELFYIPYFETDDFGPDDGRSVITSAYYIKVPGVTRADKVIVQSDVIRNRYIEELTAFAGEETKAIWEEKVVSDESIRPDRQEIGLYEDEVPDEWWKYLIDETGEGKKVLLYHVNVGNIVTYGQEYFNKMDRVFEIFSQNTSKMSILWHAAAGTGSYLEIHYPDLFAGYNEMFDKYMKMDLGIYMEDDDYTKAVAVADAYFGDRDNILYAIRKLGKPVMIQNIEV